MEQVQRAQMYDVLRRVGVRNDQIAAHLLFAKIAANINGDFLMSGESMRTIILKGEKRDVVQIAAAMLHKMFEGVVHISDPTASAEDKYEIVVSLLPDDEKINNNDTE